MHEATLRHTFFFFERTHFLWVELLWRAPGDINIFQMKTDLEDRRIFQMTYIFEVTQLALTRAGIFFWIPT